MPGAFASRPPLPERGSGLRRVRLWAVLWNVARAAMVVLILLATVEQARLGIAAAAADGLESWVAVARLFSFFTVLSNVLAGTVLAWAAVRSFATGHRGDSPALAFALAAVTTYMLVTGLVYNVVLRSVAGTDIMLGWSNDVHHVFAPAFLLLDMLVGPGRRALPWRAIAGVLVFPLVWVAYTLVRGPYLTSPSTGVAPWYPYPFLDPGVTPGGYLGVAAWVGGIAGLIAAVAWLVVLTGRVRHRHGRNRP